MGVERPAPSRYRFACGFGVDIDLGSYSTGNVIACQTFLGDPLGDEEKENFNFITAQFKLGITGDKTLVLVPHNVITDEETFKKESRKDVADAMRNMLHIQPLTRKLDRLDSDKCGEIFDDDRNFKFLEFPTPVMPLVRNSFTESRPFLEKSFIFKICRLFLAEGKIERVYPTPESEGYEGLEIINFEKVIFKLITPEDDGYFMGIVEEDECLSIQQYLSMGKKSPPFHGEDKIVVDHTSAQYFRARILQCNRCEERCPVAVATIGNCGFIGDGFLDYCDLENFQCAKCCVKGKKL